MNSTIESNGVNEDICETDGEAAFIRRIVSPLLILLYSCILLFLSSIFI